MSVAPTPTPGPKGPLFDVENDILLLSDFSALLVELFEPGTELSATALSGVHRIVDQMQRSADATRKAFMAQFGGAT